MGRNVLFGFIILFGLILTVVKAQNQTTELVVKTSHTNNINAVAYSRDGKLIASGSDDKTVKIWNAEDLSELRTFRDLKGEVYSVAISFDNRFVAAVISGDETAVNIWEIKTGYLFQTLVSDCMDYKSIAFHPKKYTLAVGCSEGTILYWNAEQQEESEEIDDDYVEFQGHTADINSLAFNADGSLLVSGSEDKTIRIWETATGKTSKELKGHLLGVNSVCFSDDSKKVVSGSSDKTIKIWNYQTTQLPKTLTNDSPLAVSSVAISLDNKFIAVGRNSKNDPSSKEIQELTLPIELWNFLTGEEIKSFGTDQTFIDQVAFSSDGKKLVTGGASTKVNIWDVESKEDEPFLLESEGYGNSVESLAISPDGSTLAWGGGIGGFLNIFDLKTGSNLRIENAYLENVSMQDIIDGNDVDYNIFSIGAVIFSDDGKYIFTGGSDGKIRKWELKSGNEIDKLESENSIISALSISSDGSIIASGQLIENNVKIWNSKSKKVTKTIALEKDSFLRTVALSPNGKSIAIGGIMSEDENFGSGKIQIFDTKTGVLQKTLEGHEFIINSLAFSKDGKSLVSYGSEFGGYESFKVWNLADGKETSDYEREEILTRLNGYTTFLKTDKRMLQFTRADARVIINDVDSGEEMASLVGFSNLDGSESNDKSNQADWFVATPNNLFDGTSGTFEEVYWRFDEDAFSNAPIESFFKEFFYPGLLQDILQGKNIETPQRDLSQIDIRQPKVLISAFDGNIVEEGKTASSNKKNVKVRLEITDNPTQGRKSNFPASSNAKDVRLFRNGSLVKLWDKNAFELNEKDGCQQFEAKQNAPQKVVCETEVQITSGVNSFSAYAFNHDNVKSSDANAQIIGAENLKRKGKIQVLAIGVNQYKNSDYNLYYAVKDAVDLGTELLQQQTKLNNFDTPEVLQLTDKEATKSNILYALEKFSKGDQASKLTVISSEIEKKFSNIEKLQPEDVLVVYFAGHGTAFKERFYLIPTDGFPIESDNEKSRIEQIQKQSISDLELEAVFRDLDAGQILLVIDACNSGQALEAEEKRRGPMNSRGLAQLAYEKGMFILTAAQSYQAALEVAVTPSGKQIEHGLLTYSLLEGVNGLKADENEDDEISEREWFGFAVREVPKLQVEEMKKRSVEVKKGEKKTDGTRKIEVFFVEGDSEENPDNRRLQTPRVFYKRESSEKSLIIATP